MLFTARLEGYQMLAAAGYKLGRTPVFPADARNDDQQHWADVNNQHAQLMAAVDRVCVLAPAPVNTTLPAIITAARDLMRAAQRTRTTSSPGNWRNTTRGDDYTNAATKLDTAIDTFLEHARADLHTDAWQPVTNREHSRTIS